MHTQGRLFNTVLHVSLSVFFGIAGILTIVIPWSNALQVKLTTLISLYPVLLSFCGAAMLAVGIMLFLLSRGSYRQYYHLKGGSRAVTIDEKVIRHYLDIYWQELLPGHDVVTEIEINGSQLHITADLPAFPFERQNSLLERIQTEVDQLLSETMKLGQELKLSISFHPDPV